MGITSEMVRDLIEYCCILVLKLFSILENARSTEGSQTRVRISASWNDKILF